jgi:GT2 family glycosyltransferase
MKISVIIVTRNRREDLIVTLNGFNKQTYKNYEIIIVDNASDDGTREMIENDYPEVKYLWLPDNFDIRSINIGIEMSDGDIIWRTDSDSNPESEHEFQKVIDIFEKHSDIDIISMEDVEVRRGNLIWEWYPIKVDKNNIPENGFKAHIFPGTGAAIRRKVYDKIGGFWEFGFEELDFCTRAIVAGFSIRYFPNIRVLHYATPTERDNSERWIRISKQFVRYTWKYFPFFKALWRFFVIFLSQLLQAIISKVSVGAFVEGILTMLTTVFSTYRKERRVVPNELLHEITMGVSLTKTQIKYFAEVFTNKFKKLIKQ